MALARSRLQWRRYLAQAKKYGCPQSFHYWESPADGHQLLADSYFFLRVVLRFAAFRFVLRLAVFRLVFRFAVFRLVFRFAVFRLVFRFAVFRLVFRLAVFRLVFRFAVFRLVFRFAVFRLVFRFAVFRFAAFLRVVRFLAAGFLAMLLLPWFRYRYSANHTHSKKMPQYAATRRLRQQIVHNYLILNLTCEVHDRNQKSVLGEKL